MNGVSITFNSARAFHSLTIACTGVPTPTCARYSESSWIFCASTPPFLSVVPSVDNIRPTERVRARCVSGLKRCRGLFARISCTNVKGDGNVGVISTTTCVISFEACDATRSFLHFLTRCPREWRAEGVHFEFLTREMRCSPCSWPECAA